MNTFTTTSALGIALDSDRQAGRSIGFVPTMGYLHEGHLALVRAAKRQNDRVIASIFVNPLQFGPNEDLDRYPSDLDRDKEQLSREGVDYLFAPSKADMYTRPPQTYVEVQGISDQFLGAERPGHFRGVTTIVAKLFALVQPSFAYFGEKDFQQLVIIRRMVQDLSLPVKVIGIPTVREIDGLACSSRNVYLSKAARQAAPGLYRALLAGEKAIQQGLCDPLDVYRVIHDSLNRHFTGKNTLNNIRIDLCNADDLTPYLEPFVFKLNHSKGSTPLFYRSLRTFGEFTSLQNALEPVRVEWDHSTPENSGKSEETGPFYDSKISNSALAPMKGECVIMISAELDKVRLIDNLIVTV